MAEKKTQASLSDDKYNKYCDILNDSLMNAVHTFYEICEMNNVSASDSNQMLNTVLSKAHASHIAYFYDCKPESLGRLIKGFKEQIIHLEKKILDRKKFHQIGEA